MKQRFRKRLIFNQQLASFRQGEEFAVGEVEFPAEQVGEHVHQNQNENEEESSDKLL